MGVEFENLMEAVIQAAKDQERLASIETVSAAMMILVHGIDGEFPVTDNAAILTRLNALVSAAIGTMVFHFRREHGMDAESTEILTNALLEMLTQHCRRGIAQVIADTERRNPNGDEQQASAEA